MGIRITVDTADAQAAIDAMVKRVAASTPIGVGKVGLLIEARAKANMEGPGPAVITGALWRSIVMEGPVRTGIGNATTSVGPTIVYGRIQELGGVIRAKNAPYLMFSFPDGDFAQVTQVTLPPRPYLAPALQWAVDGPALEVMVRTWRDAMGL